MHDFGRPCAPTACTSWPVPPGCYTWASRTTSSGGWMSTSAASPPASRLRTTSLGWSTWSSSRTFVTRLPEKKSSKAGVVHGRFACSKSATLPGKTWRIAGSRNHASHDDAHLQFLFSRPARLVILSERAARARAKDLLTPGLQPRLSDGAARARAKDLLSTPAPAPAPPGPRRAGSPASSPNTCATEALRGRRLGTPPVRPGTRPPAASYFRSYPWECRLRYRARCAAGGRHRPPRDGSRATRSRPKDHRRRFARADARDTVAPHR